MNREEEIVMLKRYFRKVVDVALDMPYIQENNLSLPIEQRKSLLTEMIEKQKRLIELMTKTSYNATQVGIEKGALKVLENYLQNLDIQPIEQTK